MSEIKRVSLTTLEPQKVSDKVNKKPLKTVRISVSLSESNEDNCPEYNYKDQLAAVKKKSKQVIKDTNYGENGVDQFDDDDVKRIALEMEAKYGTGMTGGATNANNRRRRKGRKDDYADIGMGYDESDSFIDNTDGYDEIIPQNVTTLHGGFYINCGALEFKTDDEASSAAASSSSSSESSDQEDQDGDGTGGSGEEERPQKSKKRVLDSSSSDSETASTSQAEKKQKLQTVKTTMHQAIKKKLFSSEKIQVKKRNHVDPLKKTVKDLLREKREDLEMTIPGELKEIEENVEKDSLKENKKPMSITSVTDAIESVVKQVVQEVSYDKNQNKQNIDVNTTDLSLNKTVSENSQTISVSVESSQDISKTQRQEVTKLPENLPQDITDLVNRIKMLGVNYKGEGKKAFFTDEVNLLLLNLERKCRVLGKSSRLRVYEYLSSFVVVCKKDTLMKRARSLILDQEETRLKKLEVELKDKIDYIMPALVAKFELECQSTLARKFSKESAGCEELKALKMPRRRFSWTDETKKLIKDILSFKKRCLIREGKQKDKLEEQVVNYMKTVILPLWPEGWMYPNNLKKVYNSMTSDNNRSANSNSTSDNNKTANSSFNTPTHSNTPKNAIISQTNKNEAISQPLISSVKLHPELAKQPKEKPVDMFKQYTEKHSKQQVEKSDKHAATESSKRPKIFAENTVKAHAESLDSKLQDFPKHVATPEEPSDLSMSSKMFKPYADTSAPAKTTPVDHEKRNKTPEVFKPYVEQAVAPPRPARSELAPSIESKTPARDNKVPCADKPSDLSKHKPDKSDKSKDFSQFEMFKPYADAKGGPFANNRPKEKGKSHAEYAASSSSSKHKEARSDGTAMNAHRLKDIPTIFEETTVIINNTQDPSKDHNSHSVISKATHCHGMDLSDRMRQFSPRSPEFLAAHPTYQAASTPKISKSEGDDIQMVMENLKALQKLSCSPIKNDNSSSSPVSVIAYNKNFSKGGDSNNAKGEDFPGGYQDEFQKQIISSLQQMQQNAGASKSSYNNRCS